MHWQTCLTLFGQGQGTWPPPALHTQPAPHSLSILTAYAPWGSGSAATQSPLSLISTLNGPLPLPGGPAGRSGLLPGPPKAPLMLPIPLPSPWCLVTSTATWVPHLSPILQDPRGSPTRLSPVFTVSLTHPPLLSHPEPQLGCLAPLFLLGIWPAWLQLNGGQRPWGSQGLRRWPPPPVSCMHKVPTALLEAVTEPRTARLCRRQTPRPPAPRPPMELSVPGCSSPRTDSHALRSLLGIGQVCLPPVSEGWFLHFQIALRKIKGKMASCDVGK